MDDKDIFTYNFTSKLFGEGVELLPSVTELFELELAFLEYHSLKADELIRKSAYFKSINSKSTLHFQANTFKPTFEILSRSSKTKSYFENGLFSTGYATHSLFPYRGKFHPQLIKSLLNIIGVRSGELILDPMCGSGTTNIEASLLGINSVAIDISPFCRLMTKTKYELLKAKKDELQRLLKIEDKLFDFFSAKKKYDSNKNIKLFESEPNYYLTLLAFLDSMGYFIRTRSLSHKELFSRVLERYIYTVLNYLENPFYDKENLGNVIISRDSTAMDIKFEENTFDGIITSPPYSFAIDYVSNDKDQLEYLGLNVEELKEKMIGLRGKNKTERLENYFEDMKTVCFEIARVLKPNKYAIIIIGSNTNQTGGIRLEDKIINFCEGANLKLVKSIVKPIKGLRNTMKDEYVLILKKWFKRYLMKSNEEKFRKVIEKNTFYFYNKEFEESYEGYINSIKELLLNLKNEIELNGLKKELFEKLLMEKENGLRALLALTGFSNENLKRITTLIRVVNDGELNRLLLKDKWFKEENISDEGVVEWSDSKITTMIKTEKYFRQGIVNLFFEGATIPFLAKTLPLFELKKLSISKLQYQIPDLIDTLIRYKEKGSYSGKKENNPETVIENILEEFKVTFERGDLSELIANAPDSKRTMDFIIPNKKKPLLIIESSYLVTTSSGQGDKSKTEISIDALIKQHYPNAKFIGFVDGIGWYVRKGDLKRMVSAYEDVFTFHEDELTRFKLLLKEININE